MKQLKKSSVDVASLLDLKRRFFEQKMSLSQGNANIDTSVFKKIKKEIARLLTKANLANSEAK